MVDDNYFELSEPGLALDLETFYLEIDDLLIEAEEADAALIAMNALESGATANPTEGRRVGHYWLRNPTLAPDAETRQAIESNWVALQAFVDKIEARFPHIIWLGTGGSALGPQLIARALRFQPGARRFDFIDNCDPATYERILGQADLSEVLFVIASKSGQTPETLNALALVEAECQRRSVSLAERIVAITAPGSPLEERASQEGWLAAFPIWDWVGGRTSIFSSVGLLSLMLLHGDRDAFLEGARRVDAWTREGGLGKNPALTLAACLSDAVDTGWPNLAVLPYRDQLDLFGRYLQQLVMESLGKGTIRDEGEEEMGLTVYGTKGTTDQHAFVQQLCQGSDDAVIAFIEVLSDEVANFQAELSREAGDLKSAFLAGTRAALSEVDRYCFTLTLEALDEAHLGGLIAFWERTVGFLASFWELNAYDQPGVEAGKFAAKKVLTLQEVLLAQMEEGEEQSAEGWAEVAQADPRLCFHILRHLAANHRIIATGTGRSRLFRRKLLL